MNLASVVSTITSDPMKLVGLVVSIAGLLFTWRKFREDSLRRGEVMTWANEAIATLEGLVLVCIFLPRRGLEEECRARLTEILFDSAILVERGRIFFKNQLHGDFGKEKEAAYRGFRPRILDPLIAAHQVAGRLFESDDITRLKLQCVAEDHLKVFVSLIQKEIGRDRTASLVTKQGGFGFNLDSLLAQVPTDRLEKLRVIESRSLSLYRQQPTRVSETRD